MRAVFVMVFFLLSATAGLAQSIGIQFDRMPVGTKLYYKDYEGDTWVQEYRGKSGNFHIVSEKHADRNLSVTRRYNAQGHLVSTRFVGGGEITYKPFRCERVLGTCTYRYNGNPKRNGVYKTTLTQASDGYHFSLASVSNDETFDSVIKLGPYNVLQEETWTGSNGKKRFERLIKIETP
ncbi:MAG: hypothetical protein WBO29_12140 [Albidovulum sp.]